MEKKCPKCGKMVGEEMNFCPACGTLCSDEKDERYDNLLFWNASDAKIYEQTLGCSSVLVVILKFVVVINIVIGIVGAIQTSKIITSFFETVFYSTDGSTIGFAVAAGIIVLTLISSAAVMVFLDMAADVRKIKNKLYK